jgi:hypothetical protein
MSFYGSVGWFNELPPADEITDFTKYRYESQNIPCKGEKKLKDEAIKPTKKEIIYKF